METTTKAKSLAERIREAAMKDVHEQSALMEAAAAGEDPNAAAARIIGGEFNFCDKTSESLKMGELINQAGELVMDTRPEIRFNYAGSERKGRILGSTEGDSGMIYTVALGMGMTLFGIKQEDVIEILF